MSPSKKPDPVSLYEEGSGSPRPRLHKLIVKNFRSIGSNPVEIELDDIVVLVGPNNSGKSSILRAYETVMSDGSSSAKLSINDFPNGIVDSDNYPEVELYTIIHDKAPGERWIAITEDGELLIRERWIWDSPNKAPTRQGFDVLKNNWDPQVPWGAPNVANSRRPKPHRIDAFDTPDAQAKSITKLISDLLIDRITELKSDPEQEKSDYEIILEKICQLQKIAVTATDSEIVKIEAELSRYIEAIFPKHKVKFDTKPEADLDKAFTPFKNNPEMLMGTEESYFSTISNQGSGARRTLLWATLKYLSESEDKQSSRPHVLLLDEPEICLHPSAIREARSVLYNLPETGKWQVMITSHSPIFIDLSQDNTTIIRVFRDEDSEVKSTTLYRPNRARLDVNDKRNMKLLNVCDPYLHEFFFGGTPIIVEGDTEYTAFSMIKMKYPQEYQDVQIIRARGKGIIPSVAKVLLQFAKGFSILHDTDTPLTSKGRKNPAWGMNETIRNILSLENASDRVRLVACVTCFEVAMFGEEVTSEKPYNALKRITLEPSAETKVKALLDFLINDESPIPDGCIAWKELSELSEMVPE